MNDFFRNIPKLNLGIWSAYKKLDIDQQREFQNYLRNDNLSFMDIAEMSYFSAINARERINYIKEKAEREDAMEEYNEMMMQEKERYIKEFQDEYNRLGLDPNYTHHGLNQ